MSRKFTSGKWCVNSENDARGIVCVRGNEVIEIGSAFGTYFPGASPFSNPPPIDEGRANARLMAAAPQLLEALCEAVKLLHGIKRDACTDRVIDMSRAAIRRATGTPL